MVNQCSLINNTSVLSSLLLKLYQELGLESLEKRRWHGKLFNKVEYQELVLSFLRNFQRKTLPRVKIRISRKKTMTWETLSNCKIFNKQSPTYLLNIIPVFSRSYFTRYVENVRFFKVKHIFFKKSFCSFYCYCMEQDRQKYLNILESLNIFRKAF